MPVLVPRLARPVATLGRYALLLAHAFGSVDDFRIYRRNIIEQMVRIGIESIPIIALAAGFSGAVTTVQAAYQLVSPFIPRTIIGSIVAPSIILELAAVVSAFILAGRVGARISAELGTMRVTEQIDALESLGRSPASHLLLPKVLACILMIPVLVVFADVMALVAGWFISKQSLPITDQDFAYGARIFWQPFNAWYSLIKATAFAATIGLVSCYYGYNTQHGAAGVGRSTTGAVVSSSVLILLLDLILAKLLLVP